MAAGEVGLFNLASLTEGSDRRIALRIKRVLRDVESARIEAPPGLAFYYILLTYSEEEAVVCLSDLVESIEAARLGTQVHDVVLDAQYPGGIRISLMMRYVKDLASKVVIPIPEFWSHGDLGTDPITGVESLEELYLSPDVRDRIIVLSRNAIAGTIAREISLAAHWHPRIRVISGQPVLTFESVVGRCSVKKLVAESNKFNSGCVATSKLYMRLRTYVLEYRIRIGKRTGLVKVTPKDSGI